MTSLAPHMEAFLREHLVGHRGASQHTCDSYAYSFQSLFEYAAGKLKVAPLALMLEQMDAKLISGFLEHLETARGNSARLFQPRQSPDDRLHAGSPCSRSNCSMARSTTAKGISNLGPINLPSSSVIDAQRAS
jgi:hypothetical protein